MGILIDLPNITPESIVFGDNGGSKKSNFNLKNYLNTRLGKDEKEKTITIRLLPMDLSTGNPFVKVHVHNVPIHKDLAKDGKPFKDFICLSKNNDIDHERFGTKCPFCECNNNAYKEAEKSKDPAIKKSWTDLSLQYKRREAVILRCIERGKEDEGVKFWKFKIRDDKTDPYNQILKLYQKRKEEGERAGVEVNILDIYNGRDLEITITEGTAAPKVIDSGISTPLSRDEEQMRKWIYDEKKWYEVFTCKDYEYLALILDMKYPWWDKDNKKWVDRDEYNKEHGITMNKKDSEEAKEINEKIDAVNKAVKKEVVAEEPAPVEKAEPAPVEAPKPEKKESFVSSITIDDDDLPF